MNSALVTHTVVPSLIVSTLLFADIGIGGESNLHGILNKAVACLALIHMLSL